MNDDVDLDRVWLAVAGHVWLRRPGPVERVAARVSRSPGLARALVTTPSLLVGWVIATVVVVAAGFAATVTTGTAYVPLLGPRGGWGRHRLRLWAGYRPGLGTG